MNGLVVKSTGSWYSVRSDEGQLFSCKVKGKFRLQGIRSTNPVAVGDRVRFTVAGDGTAYIYEIFDRRNFIVRKASNLSKQSHILAANVDRALLVVTLRNPETSTTFIDRFLASAEAYRVPVALLFNKCDLFDADEARAVARLVELYTGLDYECHVVSATRGTGLEPVAASLKGQTTLLAGHSGVGKSALLNHFIPEAHAKTAPVSDAHGTGMHTTTFSELFELPDGGALIDVPGVKGFGTFNMERHEISGYFREIFAVGRGCRYSDCLHLDEPGCAVREALNDGRIAASRYRSYLSMLGDEDESKYREAF